MGSAGYKRNGRRGKRVERPVATGRGKPLKVETQGCYRHETGPERRRAEQSVKRLRKPEGAAQSNVVSSV
jgi:hypothetical protein